MMSQSLMSGDRLLYTTNNAVKVEECSSFSRVVDFYNSQGLSKVCWEHMDEHLLFFMGKSS